MTESELQPWQRPPFEQGNTAALTHGAYSPKVVDPIAAELVAGIVADPATNYLAEASYRAAVWAWARAEARVIALTEHECSGSATKASLVALERWEKIASSARARLGLDPLSRARLGKDLAGARQADAVAVLTQLREDYERQQHAQPQSGEALQ